MINHIIGEGERVKPDFLLRIGYTKSGREPDGGIDLNGGGIGDDVIADHRITTGRKIAKLNTRPDIDIVRAAEHDNSSDLFDNAARMCRCAIDQANSDACRVIEEKIPLYQPAAARLKTVARRVG